MGDLDDGPVNAPQPRVVPRRHHRPVPPGLDYDLLLTHSPQGEYSSHRRHAECSAAVLDAWRCGRLRSPRLWLFAYDDGGRAYLPRVGPDADRKELLTDSVWLEKRRLITDLYGFSTSVGGPDHPARRGLLVRRFPAGRSRPPRFHGPKIMKVLVLTEYPPLAGGLSTQGTLLPRPAGDRRRCPPVHFESPLEKEWYYRWFQPDIVVGVGFWGHVPHLCLHPAKVRPAAVPWLVADGYIAAHQDVLNALPLILVTSEWVKQVYMRTARGHNIEVLPVGCETTPSPCRRDDFKVSSIREASASPRTS